MMDIELAPILLTLAFLLIVISFVQPVAKKLEISETVLLAILGIALGSASLAIINSLGFELLETPAEMLINFPINSEGFLLIFLPVLVFQGAMAIDVRSLAHETATVLLLAVVAVAVSTLTIGLAIYPFAGESLVICFLLGSIVATTDPSAVAGIFREVGAASRLGRLVEGEALFNDAAAIAIFSILIASLVAHQEIHFNEAVFDFLKEFIGATVVGAALGLAILGFVGRLGTFPAAEASLTLALPYISYIVCENMLGFSGVVGSVASGLIMSAYGPSTFRPKVWKFLEELWGQLAFWAGSLIFLLASMFVPRLMMGMTKWDWALILVASIAGLIARSIVIFGLFPILALSRIAPAVPFRFQLTMAWGGLRGAITLALALAVVENRDLSEHIARFIGIVATGFVLVTLLLNGTTLRFLVVKLGLNQLSPIDAAMRKQAISIGIGIVVKRVEKTAIEHGFYENVRRNIVKQLERRQKKINENNNFKTALDNRDQVTVALMTIASQEKTILLDFFKIPGLTRGPVIQDLLRSVEAMIDGSKLDGRLGYILARRKRLKPTFRLKFAQFLHRHFRIDRPLMNCMRDLFEMLLIAHLVSTSLLKFVEERMKTALGIHITDIVTEILIGQAKSIDDALKTLRRHYPGYAEMLEGRILRQISLYFESEEYATLANENLISPELHRELNRSIDANHQRLEKQAIGGFDLRDGIAERLAQFPIFSGVSAKTLEKLGKEASIQFVSPGTVLLTRDQKVRSVFPILSGVAEYHQAGIDRKLEPGDIIGADCFIDKRKCLAAVRIIKYSHLLVISSRKFKKFLEENPQVKVRLERANKDREELS
ncbi:sodium:proton antiporter [Acetobacteraceae bacterium]|nr:sodium:proton antiporter [Acetobacteraceae bacterium]